MPRRSPGRRPDAASLTGATLIARADAGLMALQQHLDADLLFRYRDTPGPLGRGALRPQGSSIALGSRPIKLVGRQRVVDCLAWFTHERHRLQSIPRTGVSHGSLHDQGRHPRGWHVVIRGRYPIDRPWPVRAVSPHRSQPAGQDRRGHAQSYGAGSSSRRFARIAAQSRSTFTRMARSRTREPSPKEGQ